MLGIETTIKTDLDRTIVPFESFEACIDLH